MRTLVALWRSRWGVLRLAVAAFIAWALAVDSGARLARLQLAALPDFDFAGEVRTLREQGRFGEAVMIADAGLATLDAGAERQAVERERAEAVAAQASWLRRAREFGFGALAGRGESLEALVGAVTADLFLVGDIRDLAIQGARLVVDGEADPVIAALSGIGVATTLAPEVDWGASLLKIGRKTGAMTRGLGEAVVAGVRGADKAGLSAMLKDVGTISTKTSPATALRALRGAENADDVADLARFVERTGAKAGAGGSGVVALHVMGAEGRAWAKGAVKAGAGAADAEAVLLKAARKGEAGAAFLKRGSARALLRPHPLVGLAKGLWKGNAQALAARVAERIDPLGWWLLPCVLGWAFVELGLLARRFWPGRVVPAPVVARGRLA